MKFIQVKSAILVLLFVILGCQPQSYDYLITGVTIVDGSLRAPFLSDVGIIGDEIVAISTNLRTAATLTIDGTNKILAPGFIDMHTHCDWGMDQEATRSNLNYLIQGVTSVVTGNCGYGSGDMLSFKEKFESKGIGNNMIPLTGFGWLREQVMGSEDRAPTDDEMEEMKKLFRKSLNQGSWGLSTGLQYVPEKYSSTEEIIALAELMKGTKRIYTTHMRSEEDELIEAVEEAISIARNASVSLNIAHLKANGRNNWKAMDQVFELVENAQSDGISITADMYPYDKSATTALFSVLLYPDDLNLDHIDQIIAALKNPVTRTAIKKLTSSGRPGQTNWVAKGGWNYFSIVYAPKHPEVVNRMFIELAAEQQKDPFDIAADLVIAEGEDIIISLSTMQEENLVKQMQKPWVMFSSDGSAVSQNDKGVHPRNYGSQTRVLRKYIREEKILSLQEGIHKLTGLPATSLGLDGKGYIREGYSADLVLFDLDKVQDKASFLDPHQYAEGIEYVWVNGALAIGKGSFTHRYAGKVLLAPNPIAETVGNLRH